MATLGDLERSVMDLLWDGAEAQTANDLRDRLAQAHGNDGKELAVTTVLTVLARLEKKQLVTRERDTRPHRYRAIRLLQVSGQAVKPKFGPRTAVTDHSKI